MTEIQGGTTYTYAKDGGVGTGREFCELDC
jgi:hypothetical protein